MNPTRCTSASVVNWYKSTASCSISRPRSIHTFPLNCSSCFPANISAASSPAYRASDSDCFPVDVINRLNSLAVGMPMRRASHSGEPCRTSWIIILHRTFRKYNALAMHAYSLFFRPSTAAHAMATAYLRTSVCISTNETEVFFSFDVRTFYTSSPPPRALRGKAYANPPYGVPLTNADSLTCE